ncbi:glycosyltransferase family 4 protein, partial [Pseudomonas fragi]
MKIIYLITRSDVMGGASIHLLDLAAGAKALGHDVVIGVGNANPSKQSLFQERAALMGLECYGIKSLVREISPVKDISCYLELRAFLKAHSAVSRNKCNSQLIFLSMLITKLGIPA